MTLQPDEPANPRQRAIMALAREHGRVLVDDLALRFAVSAQTIRKDLNDLCERRLLQRTHGGAIVSARVENLAYDARRQLASAEKERIGALAAALVPDNSALFINIGTTTEQVARALRVRQGLLVITNSINVVNLLRGIPGVELIVAGGLVRPADGGVVGEAAVELIRQFKVDHAIIGASAIDRDGCLLDYDFREVRVAQAIIENSRHTILVADATKFERSAPVRIARLEQIDALVTDRPPPPAIVRCCSAAGVVVHTPEEPDAAPLG